MWLTLDYGGAGQGFGGYTLYNPKYSDIDLTGFFIYRCMDVTDSLTISQMKGKPIRVKFKENGDIEAIGHFLKDEWFYPQKEIEHRVKELKYVSPNV